MLRTRSFGVVVGLVAVTAAGCGDKPVAKKPEVPPKVDEPPPVVVETEEDRAKKRIAAAQAIVPVGTSCLPQLLKGAEAPELHLAAVGKEPLVCATDRDASRLLGNIACWKLGDLSTPSLDYLDPQPLPGRNVTVNPDGRCARGYCIPPGNELGERLHMAWNVDGSKVVVIAANTAHIFDSTSRTRESGFSIVGEDTGVSNAVSAVYWVGDTIFVQGNDAGPASYVWLFKVDGTPKGPLKALGGKERTINLYGGSLSILDGNRVAVAERGFSTVTIYEVDSGKRSKIVRAVAGNPCSAGEIDTFWTESGEVSAKCKTFMTKNYEHLIGADVVSGRVNLLALLRGPRLGELVVLDINNLRERDRFKLPWCDPAAALDEAPEKPASKTRGATKKSGDEDPDAGGQ
jgi:hypothetical protein